MMYRALGAQIPRRSPCHAPSAKLHMMDKSKLLESLQRLPISFGMAMGVRPKCRKVAER